MYLDVRNNLSNPLTIDRVIQWHIWQCADQPSLLNRQLGGKRRNNNLQNQVSFAVHSEQTERHYTWQLPATSRADTELQTFIEWFNDSTQDPVLDPFIRAGIAHLWFLVLQPFHSENVRIALLLCELALAQAQPKSIHFYSISAAIVKNKLHYYSLLDETLRGDTDITKWLYGFIDILESALSGVLNDIELQQHKLLFWRSIDNTKLTIDQVHFINSLIDGNFPDGISAKEYGEFMETSAATATRHLAHLLKIGCLTRSESGGRSTKYFLQKY